MRVGEGAVAMLAGSARAGVQSAPEPCRARRDNWQLAGRGRVQWFVVWAIPKVASTRLQRRLQCKAKEGVGANGAKAKATTSSGVGALANGFCARRGPRAVRLVDETGAPRSGVVVVWRCRANGRASAWSGSGKIRGRQIHAAATTRGPRRCKE